MGVKKECGRGWVGTKSSHLFRRRTEHYCRRPDGRPRLYIPGRAHVVGANPPANGARPRAAIQSRAPAALDSTPRGCPPFLTCKGEIECVCGCDGKPCSTVAMDGFFDEVWRRVGAANARKKIFCDRKKVEDFCGAGDVLLKLWWPWD